MLLNKKVNIVNSISAHNIIRQLNVHSARFPFSDTVWLDARSETHAKATLMSKSD